MTGNTIGDAAIVLGIIGLAGAVLLFLATKIFKTEENPLVDKVLEHLPGANCGGCGFAGCHALAEAIVKAGRVGEGLTCTASSPAALKAIAQIVGGDVPEARPRMAVVRCNGSCENAPAKVDYDGVKSCYFANALYAGESACPYGCLGCGDCVAACKFGALSLNDSTGLPEVNMGKCVACGTCVAACPRHIIELRYKNPEGESFVVSCVNKEKGAVAKKNCAVACIGCGKCAKTCPCEAITIADNLAYIDDKKCQSCGQCVEVCPSGAIRVVEITKLC